MDNPDTKGLNMSGSFTNVSMSGQTALEDFCAHNIYGGSWKPPQKRVDAGTLPTITHKGGWCVYNANIFCQQSRCSDCAICENNE